MKIALTAVLIGVGVCLSLPGFIDQTQALADQGKGGNKGSEGLSLYRPPLLGAPKTRIGGGVRGSADEESPLLQVLAPAQAGQTTVEQPTLYWHLGRPTKYDVEITVMEMGGETPMVREKLSGPIAPGLHAFTLATHGQRLEIGKGYEWFVAVILDPEQRSKDILAGGGIRQVVLPVALQDQLKAAKEEELGLLYAGAGLWYDALHALVAGQNKVTDKAALNSQFTAILKQEEIAGVELTDPVKK